MKNPGDIVVYDGKPSQVVKPLFLQAIFVGYKLMQDGPSEHQVVFDVALSDPKLET